MVNLRGRINLGSQLELNAHLSQFDDQLDQNAANYLGQVDYSYSTTQEAEFRAEAAAWLKENVPTAEELEVKKTFLESNAQLPRTVRVG